MNPSATTPDASPVIAPFFPSLCALLPSLCALFFVIARARQRPKQSRSPLLSLHPFSRHCAPFFSSLRGRHSARSNPDRPCCHCALFPVIAPFFVIAPPFFRHCAPFFSSLRGRDSARSNPGRPCCHCTLSPVIVRPFFRHCEGATAPEAIPVALAVIDPLRRRDEAIPTPIP